MAAKRITGAGGAVALPTGHNAAFETWDLSLDFGEVDTTAFDDNGYYNGDLTQCKATFNAAGTSLYDDTDTAPLPASVLASTFDPSGLSGAVLLTVFTGCTYGFTGAVSTYNTSRSSKSGTKADVGYSGFNQGAITQTWDTTGA